MNVTSLLPQPTNYEPFRRDRGKHVSNASGCYVLCRYDGTILYIGLSNNLRRRMLEHLDSPAKASETAKGRATLFYWLETGELQKVERTWLNAYEFDQGEPPIMNLARSPISGV